MKNLISGVAAALLMMATTATTGNAIPVSQTTFAFSGECDDCAGILEPDNLHHARNDGSYQDVTGTLVLQNFQPGTPLNASNFVSFSYDGSSILKPFSVTASESPDLFGTLSQSGAITSTYFGLIWHQPSPGLATTSTPESYINCLECAFQVSQAGDWLLGKAPADQGINGEFAAIPEPGTLSLLGIGLAAIAVMMALRRPNSPRSARWLG